jgi:hypothetical protein
MSSPPRTTPTSCAPSSSPRSRPRSWPTPPSTGWYDLRNQSLFDDSFRNDVLEIEARREDMIWRVVSRYCEHRGSAPTLTPGVAYTTIDGIFQRALLHQLAGRTDGAETVRDQLDSVFALLGAPQ